MQNFIPSLLRSSWELLYRYFHCYLKGVYSSWVQGPFSSGCMIRADINFLCQLFEGFWKHLSSYRLPFMSSLGTKVFTLYMLGVPQTKNYHFLCSPRISAQGRFRNPRGRIGNYSNTGGKKANLKTNVNKEIVCIRMDWWMEKLNIKGLICGGFHRKAGGTMERRYLKCAVTRRGCVECV